ncbi:hypothetical protein CASFOL_008147 [Castilleja foliolosa]|uniref:S1 motif domain-containing protein n=1 Tax=Castilleja foliolosa TaxID=1961234 RepID=A0ABD3E249_9LAMI
MDSLTLSTSTTTNCFSAIQFFSQPLRHAKSSTILSFPYRKPRNLMVFASKDESKLDEWEQMELKFGRMIGEDPKITLAKIMGRKSNPDLSYLEIEKLLDKKNGSKSWGEIEDIPFDLSDEKKPTKSVQGLNLVRPVPKKGTKFETTNKAAEADSKQISSRPVKNSTEETKSSVPNVILRKPSLFNDNDDNGVNGQSSRFGMKPNLSLKMGKEPQRERFSDITLLRKPEQIDSSDEISGVVDEIGDRGTKYELLQKPEPMNVNFDKEREQESFKELTESEFDHYDQLVTKNKDSGLDGGSAIELQSEMSSGEETSEISMNSMLKGKPKRLDRPSIATDQKVRSEEVIPENPKSFGNHSELDNFLTTSPIKEREDVDWARAEKLVKTGEREEVEIISSSTRGFVVSFGSLIGFLPYRNLAARWKFLAFESWLRRKGLDPSNYRQNLGIIGKYEANSMGDTSVSIVDPEIGSKADEAITSDMKLEDLLMIYDQEKLKFLSSFVGQRIRVGVVLADRNSRKLILSIKPKEKEELIEKKRSLMARLNVGDVVKCCIKKITYFGVFVEVEGVPALIHQTEVSWDATLDPASYFKVGQIVDAKVHQLDFSLERIFLSLKEITPDPLLEALEAVVGDHDPLDGRLEAAEADMEWDDVESLIKELHQFDGIQSVSKGRYFISPGLAPTFQVYMASMFENQYKLLARAGNRVQEVIVQTSLSKDELKSAIMTCTNRVE